MSHPNALALEGHALGEVEASVTEHLAACEACRAYVARVRGVMEEASPVVPRFEAEVVALADRRSAPEETTRLRGAAPLLVLFAAAAAVLLATAGPRPGSPTPVASAPVAPPTAPPTATAERLLMARNEPSAEEPSTRFKGGLSLAVVRERGADQARFVGSVRVRSGDRLRLEVALDRSEAILGGVLGEDGSWLEVIPEGTRPAGTHLAERSARVDATPSRGVFLVGRPEDVARARALGDARSAPGVKILAIDLESP